MAKKIKTDITDTAVSTPAVAVEQERGRKPRKKVYERVKESAIPQELRDHFKLDNYDLRLCRWAINGEEDYRYLSRREKEGYEFVTMLELPEWYKMSVRAIDTKSRKGLITMGDLVLMKIDCDLRISRIADVNAATDEQIASVDVHVLEKKGFRNLGTKSKVMLREPSFQE